MPESPVLSQNAARATKRVKYKKPPIVQRVASVTGLIPPDVFHANFAAWKSIVEKEFPDYDPLQQWVLNYKEQEQEEGSVPTLTDAPPEVLVTHRFWKRNPDNLRFMSMRLLPNRLTINLHHEKDKPHEFEELFEEFMRWVPRWASHFSATEFSVVQLDYVNLIAVETTPQFVDGDGGVRIGEVLKVFSAVPGEHEGIIPPYNCQIGLMIDRNRPAIIRMRVQGLTFRRALGSGVRVDFQAITDRSIRPLTIGDVAGETNFLHDVIIEKFESIFTNSAKASFQPE